MWFCYSGMRFAAADLPTICGWKATTTVQVYKSLGSRGQQRQQKTDITSKTAIRTNLQVHRYQQGEMKFLPSTLQQFKHQHEKAIHMIFRSSGARLWLSLLKTRELENVMLPQTNLEPKKKRHLGYRLSERCPCEIPC